MSAAEAHGIATGMLCVDATTAAENWLSELFVEASPDDDSTVLLSHLFEQTSALLASDEYSFDLLLPDDDVDMAQRVEALRSWCQGFLFGVGYAHGADEAVEDTAMARSNVAEWPGETGEILKDIVEFTKMESTADGLIEEQEAAAFVEINEYLRMAVFLIRNEFNQNTDATLH